MTHTSIGIGSKWAVFDTLQSESYSVFFESYCPLTTGDSVETKSKVYYSIRIANKEKNDFTVLLSCYS